MDSPFESPSLMRESCASEGEKNEKKMWMEFSQTNSFSRVVNQIFFIKSRCLSLLAGKPQKASVIYDVMPAPVYLEDGVV